MSPFKVEKVNNYSILHAPLSTFTKVKNFTDGEELHIVQLTNSNSGAITRGAVVSSGVLKDIIELPEEGIEFINLFQKKNPIWFVKGEFLTNLAKYGHSTSPFLREADGKPQINPMDYVSKNIMEDLSNPDYQFVQFVPNSHSKSAWKTSNGTIFVEPFILDYRDGQLDNDTYFLDDFVEKLSHRNDVALLTNMGRFSKEKPSILYCPLKGDEKGIGNVISDIEHHLEPGESRPAATEQAHVVFHPKQEDITKILNWHSSVDGRTPESRKYQMYFVERFIVQDILGGKEFLQNPPTEEVEPPKRKFKH